MVASGGGSVTCTFDEVAPDSAIIAFDVPVTSPAGPVASGTATVTATTPTPEHGWSSNTYSQLLTHRLTAPSPTVLVTPSTEVVDGSSVQVQILDFPSFASIVVLQCQGEVTPTPQTCDLGTLDVRQVDETGSLTLTRGVSRFIVTDAGLIDCAVEPCAIVASGFGTAAGHGIGADRVRRAASHRLVRRHR